MKLHSPQFERRLRRAVKKAVRGSRELRRQARAGRKRSRYPNALFRPVFSIILGSLVYHAADRSGHAASGLAVMTLWCAEWLVVRAQILLACLYTSPDLRVFATLPVTMPVVFRWQMWKFWRGSPFLLIDLLAGYVAIAFFCSQPAAGFAVVPAAVLSWAACHSLVLLCAARFRRLPYPSIATAFILSGVALFFLWRLVGNTFFDLLNQIAPVLNALLPTGWAPSLFCLAMNKSFVSLIFLLPIGALLYSTRSSLALLRTGYRFGEPVHPQAPDILPANVQLQARRSGPEIPLRVGPTMVEEIITTRQFLAAPSWQHKGWLESRLWNWLGPREKALADFAFPNGITMTSTWIKIFRNLAIMVAAVFLAGFAAWALQLWALIIGLVVIALQLLLQVVAFGTPFRRLFYNGVMISFHAMYGVGYRELSRMLLKCTALQAPFVILVAAICGGAIGYAAKLPIADTLLMGLKCGGLVVAARFINLVFAFSSTTNDNARFSLRTVLLLIFMLGCGGMFLLLGGAGIFVPDHLAAWFLWFLALCDAFVFFAVYGLFYRFGRVDLMSLPRR